MLRSHIERAFGVRMHDRLSREDDERALERRRLVVADLDVRAPSPFRPAVDNLKDKAFDRLMDALSTSFVVVIRGLVYYTLISLTRSDFEGGHSL